MRNHQTRSEKPAGARSRPMWLRQMLPVMAMFTAIQVMFAFEFYSRRLAQGAPISLWRATAGYVPAWFLWMLVCPGLYLFARKFRIDQEIDRWNLLVHTAFFLGFVLVFFSLYQAFLVLLSITIQGLSVRQALVGLSKEPLLQWSVLGIRILGSYALTLAGYYYLFSRQESRERLLSESRLQAQLATTTLNALKSQLHPHFLFNAMNAISTLIRTEPRGAERMLNLLANLLRRSLKESKFQVVPLNQEVDFVRSYLEIEQIRFSDRLNVEYDLAPEILDALVPHLILQPLVENAVRHGLAPKAEPGTIRIQARRAGERLSLSVSDDGVGCQSNGRRPEPEGLGLPNTRARLEQLFGECFEMQAGPQAQRGFSVQIFLPLSLEKPTNGGLS